MERIDEAFAGEEPAPRLHRVRRIRNPLARNARDETESVRSDGYPDLLDLTEYRLGANGPRVWLFDWQAELLEPGDLRPDYESDVENHLALAGLLGLESLFDRGEISRDEDEQWFRAVWLFFQSRKKLQEYLGARRLRSFRDLRISASEHDGLLSRQNPDTDEQFVVPGLKDKAGFQSFLGAGRRAAGVPHGLYSPEIASHAFDEQAKAGDGKELDEDTIWQYVFGSLFGPRVRKGGEQEEAITRKEATRSWQHPFARRIWAWFCTHRDPEKYPPEKLWKLLHSSVFRDLAGQKKKPVAGGLWEGGKLDPGECRRAFAALVSCSFHYLAWWHQQFCRDMKAALCKIAGPPSQAEDILLDRIHMPNRYFAGLPAVLLADRLWSLRPALRELWLSPPNRPASPIARRVPIVLLLYG